MAKFCGKCGSRLDDSTGLCPKCNAEQLQVNRKKKAHGNNSRRGSTSKPKGKKKKSVIPKLILTLFMLVLVALAVVIVLDCKGIITITEEHYVELKESIGLGDGDDDNDSETANAEIDNTDVIIDTEAVTADSEALTEQTGASESNVTETAVETADTSATVSESETTAETIEDVEGEIISEANEYAVSGDYMAAISLIEEYIDEYGGSDDLYALSQMYKDTYIGNTIAEIGDCIENEDFNSAEKLLNSVLETFPENSDLRDVEKLLEESKAKAEACKYIGDDIIAYNSSGYDEYDGSSTFSMGGVPYKRGFTFGGYNNKYANYNLAGQYKYLAGVVGNVDGVNADATYNILGDDELIGTVKVTGGCLPIEFEISVSGVKQLTIVLVDGGSAKVGFGNVVLYNNESDKPELYETVDQPLTAYLGADITAYVNGGYYDEYSGMSTFSMGGNAYSKGFVIGGSKRYACYNLQGNYTVISGSVGNIDGVSKDAVYNFLGDGEVIGTVTVIGGALPVDFRATPHKV